MSTMKFLTSRASFLLSSSCSSFAATHFPLYILQVSHFSSASNYTTPYYSNFRRQDEESRSVRVSVWWDFENCNLPAGVNVFKVSSSIIAAVRANGIKGPVHITAFGDMLQLSRAKQEALSSTGVNLTHIPHGGNNSADRSLLLDLMYWVSQNPPPAHLFLISGDRDFTSVLHRLRMSNYNILLASPESVPGVLCSAATIMWHWHDLLKGNNLTGKHFNQPPDGPYGSWYGHYKLPLEKPVLNSEQQSSSQNDELPEPSSDFKLRPIPKVVVWKIQQILNDHPKGLSILDLRSELRKNKLTVDKDLYGYQKFSRFLLAMPDILRLQSKGDGHFMVCSATSKAPEPSEGNLDISDSVSNYEHHDIYVPSTSSSAYSSDNGGVESNFPLPTSLEKSSTTPSTDLNAQKVVMEDHRYPLVENKLNVDLSTSLDGKAINVTNEQDVCITSGQESTSHLSSVNVQCSSSEISFMKRIWKKWFAANGDGPKNENHKYQEKKCTFQDGSKKKVPFETNIASSNISHKVESSLKSTVPIVDPTPPSSSSLLSYESVLHNKAASSETCSGNGKNNIKACTSQNYYEKKGPFETNIASNSVSNKEKSISKSTAPVVVDSTPLSSSPLSSYESALHNKDAPSEGCTGKDNRSLSYLSKIKNWCKFWISTPSSDETSDHSGKIPPSIGGGGSVKHELFSDNSFWSEMESFMNKHQGSCLISESRTRGQVAHNLQNEGPLSLRSLSENDLLLLVDLLISEKRWVVECPSQIKPFKLVSSFVKNSCLGDPHSTNELKSNILGMQSQSDTHKSSEHGREANSENAQHTEAKLVSEKNPLFRSRHEVLANCQKLLKEILKEHSEGYNIGLFKNLFLKRYGYQLDYQKLGYRKLAYLLQIMPKVKVESGFVIPKDKAPGSLTFENVVSGKQDKVNNRASNSDSELSDPSSKDDDSDSPWEDLGPLVNIRSKKSELKFLPTKRASERQRGFTYEPSLSDDELSDSEEERSPTFGAEGHKKANVDKGESALLQILDSWHSSKESDITKVKSVNVECTIDCSKDISKLSGPSVTSGMSEASLVNLGRRQRTQKSYNFVSDPVTDNDELVDEIFGSLRKTSESRMKS